MPPLLTRVCSFLAAVKRLDALWQINTFITLVALTLDAVDDNFDCDCDDILKKVVSLLRPFVWEDEDGLKKNSVWSVPTRNIDTMTIGRSDRVREL